MGKKVKEFKAGDFIFAKVKGYPAWPARIQSLNGKKYFIYFYGTGETANLAHNVIFDYAENKDKFLNKTIKRKDFNDGVKQIEYDFANNISIEEVLGGPVGDPADTSTANVTDATLDASSAADTTVNDTFNESSTSFTATLEPAAAGGDSDDGALVIDEGKKKKPLPPGKAASTPKTVKALKTPKAKKDDAAPASGAVEEDKEEIVSRSGRKIRPKRYVDEQTEENATLPSPIPKKRRTSGEKETADKAKPAAQQGEKGKNYVAFTVSELEDIKEASAEAIPTVKKPSKLYKTPSLQKTDLGNLLFGSLNILNEENTFPEISIQKTLSNDLLDIPQEQTKSDVTELLTTKDLESFSSVVSLNKVYKDLDAKSKDSIVLTEILEKNEYKILVGDEFCKLFAGNDVKMINKMGFKPMSLINGDMGVKKFYKDLCKDGNEIFNGISCEMESDKESILIACLPSGQYVGVKLFQSVPTSFKNEDSKLNWYRQAASNALTLHGQLEKGHITAQSISAQLETDLNLTDEEKSNLDKEREIEEKKLRVQFLKTEMKLIELDAKIKSCLSLEKADTELCLKLIDELMELDIKALMLLKHPTCLETVKRMRAYVGNTPSWELSEDEALSFTKHAHAIRKQADRVYRQFKDLFTSPDGLSFWEFFSERVLQFKKCTQKLSADELLEMVHEPKGKKRAAAAATPTKEPAAKEPSTKETPAKATPKETPTKEKSKETTTKVVTKETKETPTKATPKRQAPRDRSEKKIEENKKLEQNKKGEQNKKAEESKKAEADKKVEESKKEADKKVEESESKIEDSQVGAGVGKDDDFNNAVENFEKGPDKDTEKKPTKRQEKANKSKAALNKKKETKKEAANKKDSESKDSEKVSENPEPEKVSEKTDSETVSENKDLEKVSDTNDAEKVSEKTDSETKVGETKVAETKVAESKVTESNVAEDKAEESTKDADLETAKPIEEKMDIDEVKTDEVKEVTQQNGAEDTAAVESTDNDSKDKDSAVVDKDDEPKAKRPRECNKKAEPCTPKTPTKRKSRS